MTQGHQSHNGVRPLASKSDLEFQYVTGQGHASHARLFEDFRAACQRADSLAGWRWNVPYGTHPRQVMDLRQASDPARAILIYLHAGYWQSRDKSQFRFIVPPLNDAGFHVAMVNYPLCPDVSVADIVAGLRGLPAKVRAMMPAASADAPLIVMGHSAGAHLAIEMALESLNDGSDGGRVDGVFGISGVYELLPLVATTLNARLQLDAQTAIRSSPGRRLAGPLPPAVFVAGDNETQAFLQQTQAISNAWQAFGKSRYAFAQSDDHFSILTSLLDAEGLLRQLLEQLLSEIGENG